MKHNISQVIYALHRFGLDHYPEGAKPLFLFERKLF
jgi:hypothetical protein